MSPQKKTAGGGGGTTTTGGQNRKAKGASGQKESNASAEQHNPQNSTANSKKHNIANSNVNNNNSTDQLKTEKEKPHAKVSCVQQLKQLSALLLFSFTLVHLFVFLLFPSSSSSTHSRHRRHCSLCVYDDCLQFSCKLKTNENKCVNNCVYGIFLQIPLRALHFTVCEIKTKTF